MPLDIQTLIVVNAANAMVMAAILPFVMHRALSSAASSARASLMVQGLGWIAIILSSLWVNAWPDRLLSTVSITCTSVGQLLMWHALQGWLGRRRGKLLLQVLVVLTPLGYFLSFDSYPLRVGWSNLALACQLLLVCQATLYPKSRLGGRWRWVIFGCTLTMAVLTAGRGVMGAFFTALYPTFKTPHPVNVLAMLATNVTLVLGNVAVLVAWREEAEAQLREQSFTDNLTGALNRRGWDERAAALLDQARRHGTPLALVLLDLDHFKQINDTHGHEAGDQVLRLLGKVLSESRRKSDLVARIGGEEFALLLPHTSQDAALRFEQRLRNAFAQAASSSQTRATGYSAGLAMLEPADTDVAALMARADRGLYQAKDSGRGCLRMAA